MDFERMYFDKIDNLRFWKIDLFRKICFIHELFRKLICAYEERCGPELSIRSAWALAFSIVINQGSLQGTFIIFFLVVDASEMKFEPIFFKKNTDLSLPGFLDNS